MEVLGADFRPEYVRFYPDGYSVRFPCATSLRLPREASSSPTNIEIGGGYTEEVLAVLNAWAIPDQQSGTEPEPEPKG